MVVRVLAVVEKWSRTARLLRRAKCPPGAVRSWGRLTLPPYHPTTLPPYHPTTRSPPHLPHLLACREPAAGTPQPPFARRKTRAHFWSFS